MTVNEFIEVLKETGDENFRNQAKVRVCVSGGSDWEEDIDRFNVKYGINSVDINIDIPYDEDADCDSCDDEDA